MKERGLSADHPVVLIPGVVSTVSASLLSYISLHIEGDIKALESWSTYPEYRPFFREKLWGGFNMLSQVTFNKERWIAAMMLDPVTGLDPPHAKIRAAEGIDAASSLIQGYWIWYAVLFTITTISHCS